jgi:hypothetical protein
VRVETWAEAGSSDGPRRWWWRALGPFREFGMLAGALYALDRLLRMLSPRVGLHVYELLEQPIDGRALLPGRLAQNLEFGEIGLGHPALDAMPARPEIKRSRFAQGARCLGVWRKGLLLGYIWWCPRRYEEDEVRCIFELEPAEASVFDFDLYVFPEHRLGIAFPAIWHGANRWLYDRGVRHSFSRVTLFNLASRRAHARLGGRRLGTAVFVQAWRFEGLLSTLPPFVGASLDASGRMRLHLNPARGR